MFVCLLTLFMQYSAARDREGRCLTPQGPMDHKTGEETFSRGREANFFHSFLLLNKKEESWQWENAELGE